MYFRHKEASPFGREAPDGGFSLTNNGIGYEKHQQVLNGIKYSWGKRLGTGNTGDKNIPSLIWQTWELWGKRLVSLNPLIIRKKKSGCAQPPGSANFPCQGSYSNWQVGYLQRDGEACRRRPEPARGQSCTGMILTARVWASSPVMQRRLLGQLRTMRMSHALWMAE